MAHEELSLLLFIYIVGISWTLIGIIWFELDLKIGERVQFVLLWPIIWVFLGALVFSFGVDRFFEKAMDIGEYIQYKVKRNK